ncbi:MAG: OmpA family protein [Alphaproteobacteria bacterium]|nr:OmpA family protein [Alphaproteobacteria bacterium]
MVHARDLRPRSAGSAMGRVALIGAIAVVLVLVGVAALRSTSGARHSATVSVRSEQGEDAEPGIFAFLFPPAREARRLGLTARGEPAATPDSGAKPQPALQEPALQKPALQKPALQEPALQEPAPQQPAGIIGSDPAAQTTAGTIVAETAALPPPEAAGVVVAASPPTELPAPASAAPNPAAPAGALPVMPKLNLQQKPAPLSALLAVSGPAAEARPMPPEGQVQVAEIEAPVSLPKPNAIKTPPSPARKGETGAKRSRAVEIEPLPAGPLIPPATVAGGPPDTRPSLSLDTSLAPLAMHANASSANSAGATGPGADAGTVAAPEPEASLLSARAATMPPAAGSAGEPIAFGRVVFETNATDLPQDAGGDLAAVVQATLADAQRRVQLIAYASGDADGGNQARRMALSRALAVRAYLVQQGIAGDRLQVRALGNRNQGGPEDRVDLLVGNR